MSEWINVEEKLPPEGVKQVIGWLTMLPADERMDLMGMVRIPLTDGRVFWQEPKYEDEFGDE